MFALARHERVARVAFQEDRRQLALQCRAELFGDGVDRTGRTLHVSLINENAQAAEVARGGRL